MSGKARPSLRKKTLENVRFCNLSQTDKDCIFELFRRYEEMPAEVVLCKDCLYWGGEVFGYICRRFSGTTLRNETRAYDFCSCGVRKGDVR